MHGDTFGQHVALDEDNAVIGAPFAYVNDELQQGYAYLFKRDRGEWCLSITS